MVWVIVGASLAVAALASIGYFAFGVFRAVKGLMKEVGKASRLLSETAAPVQAGLARMQSGDGARPGGASDDR
jgi:hypothetical protein